MHSAPNNAFTALASSDALNNLTSPITVGVASNASFGATAPLYCTIGRLTSAGVLDVTQPYEYAEITALPFGQVTLTRDNPVAHRGTPTIMATADGRLFAEMQAAIAGAGVGIGAAVTGGSANGVLYADGDSQVAQAAGFTFDGSTLSVSALAAASATMSGAIAMGNHAITGLADPTNAQDAATRAWVLATTAPVAKLLVLASSSTQNVPSGAATKVEFPTTVQNDGGFVVTSNTDIAVPATGLYRLQASVKATASGGPIGSLQAFLNSSQVGEVQQVPTTPHSTIGGIANLLNYWKLDESSGSTLVDSSASAQNGSQVGGVRISGPAPNAGLAYYRKLDDGWYLNFGNVGYSPTAISYACWIYLPNGSQQNLITKKTTGGTNWHMITDGGTNLKFYSPDGNITGAHLNNTTWYHVAYTHDFATGVAKLYINGAETVGATGWTTPMPNNSDALYIGYLVDDGQRSNMYVSEFAVFARALTASEIGVLYSNATRSASGSNILTVTIPGAPYTGQTYQLQTAFAATAGDVLTVKFWHEKGSDDILAGAGYVPRLILEKVG